MIVIQLPEAANPGRTPPLLSPNIQMSTGVPQGNATPYARSTPRTAVALSLFQCTAVVGIVRSQTQSWEVQFQRLLLVALLRSYQSQSHNQALQR